MKAYEKTVLRISHTEKDTKLLGPYNRFVIWVHGCCFDCEGCLAVNTRYGAYTETDIESLAAGIAESGCEGVTISGGEPFLQAAALGELVRLVRKTRDIGVIVYSGFTLDELKARQDSAELLMETDILIDGRYERELDDGRAYVGSSNQKIHYLTDRYKEIGREYYAQHKRRAEIKFTPDEVILIGVPSKGVLKMWQDIKEKSGGGNNDF